MSKRSGSGAATPRQPSTRPESSKGRGPNKPTYRGRRLARPASRGKHSR